MKKVMFTLCAGLFLASACSNTTENSGADLSGVFYGTLPCADCAGIETSLLFNNDGTYRASEMYLKNDKEEFASSGKWELSKNGKTVTLTDAEGIKNYYSLLDGALVKLDMNGEKIESELNYTLTKKVVEFKDIMGKVWHLAQLRAENGDVLFDAANLDREFFGDAYTLQFDSERAAGKAAPNRYTAPYTLGKGKTLAFKPAASTRMMAIRQPEGLGESEFFNLLGKVYAWEMDGEQLVLSALNAEGKKVDMIFNEFDYR